MLKNRLGQKPLGLELMFTPFKNWNRLQLSKQFEYCFFEENQLSFSSLRSYRKSDVILQLNPLNIKEVKRSKRFFTVVLKQRDQWTGDYPEFLIPFGPCPKKMIFRLTSQKALEHTFISFLEQHQVVIQFI